jgi:predicted TIM-barrel fold metal-dependent hydrolase
MNDLSNSSKTLVDCHVHLAAFSDDGNGCYISPKMLRSPLFRFLLWKYRLNPATPRVTNEQYVTALHEELRASRHVRQAVLLGMDGVYTEQGLLSHDRTAFLIHNDYVLSVARRYPHEFLPGVSINPQRRDAVDEVHRCAEAGAVLVKVLPHAQAFDPAQARYKEFYRTLAHYRLPLLSHVGYEFSLHGHDQSAGDPQRLRMALEEGVPVVAAHGCSQGLIFREPYYKTLVSFMHAYPHFAVDLSALTLPNRCLMLFRLRRHPEFFYRYLFGKDYPLSVFHMPIWGRAGWNEIIALWRTKNRFDRQYGVLKAFGLGFQSLPAFSRTV